MRLTLIEHRKAGVFRRYVCPRRQATILTATVLGDQDSGDVIYLTVQPMRGERRYGPKRYGRSAHHLTSVLPRDFGV
jgi:hypothetical protein